MNLADHIPVFASKYCYDLINNHDFSFVIKNDRVTKFGDYSYHFFSKKHTITINNGLNKYLFLITFIHEVAHYTTFQKFGSSVLPHGKEWKAEFIRLMNPLLSLQVFSEDLLYKIKKHLKNPKSSIVFDNQLYLSIRKYDKYQSIFLCEVSKNSLFYYKKKLFKKGDLIKSRYICEEIRLKKDYYISKNAEIMPFEGTSHTS